MSRTYERVRLVVIQAGESVYFDKYYTDVLTALDKFNYFCNIAKVNHASEPEFILGRTERYNEMSIYFPQNEENPLNQSGFVQISIYFEVG